jgi:hypothetical protein
MRTSAGRGWRGRISSRRGWRGRTSAGRGWRGRTSFTPISGNQTGPATTRASPAQFADFRGAQALTQARLDQLIGNEDTLLPDGPSDTGAPFHVWSCWETPPEGFDALVARVAELTGGNPDSIRAEFLCGPDNPRRKTGTPWPLDKPRPEGHPLGPRLSRPGRFDVRQPKIIEDESP